MNNKSLPRHWQQFDSRWSRASRVEKFIIVSIVLHVLIAFIWGLPKYFAFLKKQEIAQQREELEEQQEKKQDEELALIEEEIKDQEVDELADTQLRDFFEELTEDLLEQDIMDMLWEDILGHLDEDLEELQEFLASEEYDELEADEMIKDLKSRMIDKLYDEMAKMTQSKWKEAYLKALEEARKKLAEVFKKELDRRIANSLSNDTENLFRRTVRDVQNRVNSAKSELTYAKRDADNIRKAIEQSNGRIKDAGNKLTREQKTRTDAQAQLNTDKVKADKNKTAQLERTVKDSQARAANLETAIKRENKYVSDQEKRLDGVHKRLVKAETAIQDISNKVADRIFVLETEQVGKARKEMQAEKTELDQAKAETAHKEGEAAKDTMTHITKETNEAIKDLSRIDANKVVRDWLKELAAKMEKEMMQKEFREAFDQEYEDKALPELLKKVNESFQKQADKYGLMPPKMYIDKEAHEILVDLPDDVEAGKTSTYRLNDRYKLEKVKGKPRDGEIEKKVSKEMEDITKKLIKQHMPDVVGAALGKDSWLPKMGHMEGDDAGNVELLGRLENMKNQLGEGRDEFLGKGNHSALAGARQRASSFDRMRGRMRGRRSGRWQFDREAFMELVESMKNRENAIGGDMGLKGESAEIMKIEEKPEFKAAFVLAPGQDRLKRAEKEAKEQIKREYKEPEFEFNRFAAIPYLNSPIEVDGDLSDWKERKLEPMPMTLVKGPKPAGINKQDLWIAYDANGIYFALDVHDTTGNIENHRPLREFWFNDCIEVFIDSLNTKYGQRGETHTHQFFIFPFGQKDEPQIGGYEARYKGTSPNIDSWKTAKHGMTEIKRAAKKTPKGWTLEFMLAKDIVRWKRERRPQKDPVTGLPAPKAAASNDLKPGRIIGFDISACTGSNSYFYWTMKENIQVSTHPNSWGDIQFLGSDAEIFVVDKEGEKSEPPIVPGKAMHMQVEDGDMNLSVKKVDKVRVSVAAASGDYEEVVLEETGKNTGTFRGAIPTRPNIGALKLGELDLFEGEKVTLSYIDQAQAYGERNVRVSEEYFATSTGARFTRE